MTAIEVLERLPTSGLSERDLVRGYAWPATVSRSVPCACGGRIESVDDEREIATAVAVHNESTIHRQWRARREQG